MNDEGKIKLNNQAAPVKEGLFIIVKQTKEGGVLISSTHPYQHDTKQEAIAEAERLAKEVVGAQFHVFQAISTSQTKVSPVTTTKFKV